jgi:hypothetical protein
LQTRHSSWTELQQNIDQHCKTVPELNAAITEKVAMAGKKQSESFETNQRMDFFELVQNWIVGKPLAFLSTEDFGDPQTGTQSLSNITDTRATSIKWGIFAEVDGQRFRRMLQCSFHLIVRSHPKEISQNRVSRRVQKRLQITLKIVDRT